MPTLLPIGSPVLVPITPSNILASRRNIVAMELGNRADILQLGTNGMPSRVDNWIWQSYLSLGMSYRFAEAEVSSTDTWESGEEFLDYPADARAIINVSFFRKNGNPLRVSWKDINFIRRYPVASSSGIANIGPPAIIATYAQRIYIRPLCDMNIYDVQIDYWQKPQLIVGQSSDTPAYVSAGANDIGATLLNVPDDWLEIIDYGAKLRGHVDLGEPDKAQMLQQLLYGFTIPTSGKFVPGLIATMWTRRQAEAPQMEYSLQPTSQRRNYTNSGN